MFKGWSLVDYIAWAFTIGVIIYLLSFFVPVFLAYLVVIPVVRS